MTADTPPIKLYTALLAAMREFGAVKKDRQNPAFRSSYATLNSILEAVEGPLNDHGLILVQRFSHDANYAVLLTELIHAESGECITSAVPIACSEPNNPQKVGGAITYYRRYSLLTLLNLTPEEDDDGNSASQAPRRDQQPAARPNGQQRYDHARQHGKDPATNDAPMWNDIEEAREDDFRRSVQRAGGFTDTNRPAPPARTTPPAAQPVAPSAPQHKVAPMMDETFSNVIDGAWRVFHDGKSYEMVVGYLNEARPHMSDKQKDEARKQLALIKGEYDARDAALAPPAPRPASYAG